jgi:endoglucanase
MWRCPSLLAVCGRSVGLLALGLALLVLAWQGCAMPPKSLLSTGVNAVALASSAKPMPTRSVLKQALLDSWQQYRQAFIQADGRVIDHQAMAISTSEGQAYAMLRALWVNDAETFSSVWTWGQHNLAVRGDHLWAWKWGQKPDGQWGPLDTTAASDADMDAAMALLLAAKRWHNPTYRQAAMAMLGDIWQKQTMATPWGRVLLPGDWDWQRLPENAGDANSKQWHSIRLNPSYLSPVACRLFAQVATDPTQQWAQLRTTGNRIAEASVALSDKRGLPADWVTLNLSKAKGPLQQYLKPLPAPLSQFGPDAIRVFWRYGLEATLFGDVPAPVRTMLQQQSQALGKTWQTALSPPASPVAPSASASLGALAGLGKLLGLGLNPKHGDINTHALYGATLLPLLVAHPALATAQINGLVLPGLRQQIPASKDEYYAQNWLWLGLASAYSQQYRHSPKTGSHDTTPQTPLDKLNQWFSLN